MRIRRVMAIARAAASAATARAAVAGAAAVATVGAARRSVVTATVARDVAAPRRATAARRVAVAAVLAVPLVAVNVSAAQANESPQWTAVPVDTTQSFRGLAVLDADTAWVSGSDGGVWRTDDGGRTWDDVSPAGAEGMAFRDIEVHDDRRASVLAIGEGDASRIYTTTDGGTTWRLAFRNDEPSAFYNCMDFFPGGRRGLAVSDPVNGAFRILATYDGGESWQVLPDDGMPDALPDEYNFSASGTCLVTAGAHDVWFASGGAGSRIFHSRDGGLTWSVSEAPIPAGESSGVNALAFRGPRHGVAVGGDFAAPEGEVSSAVTRNGRTWRAAGATTGYRSGVDWLGNALIAVGMTGSDISYDRGRTWTQFDTTRYDAVVCTDGTCWASGASGTVARLHR